jgi:hypothetical protein
MFSDRAQTVARGILSERPEATPARVLSSFEEFQQADDMAGAFLVMEAWSQAPTFSVVKVAKFAKNERYSADYGPILQWIKDDLLGGSPSVDPRLAKESAALWVTGVLAERQTQ